MKNKFKWLNKIGIPIILYAALFQSCEKEHKKDLGIELQKISNQVTLNDVIRLAETIDFNPKNGLKSIQNNKKKKIKRFKEIKDNNQNLFYIINYESNNGFIVISGNRKAVPVLAYSENGEFPIDSLYGGILEWFVYNKLYVKNIINDTSDITSFNIDLWKSFDSQQVVPDEPEEPDYENITTIFRTYGPLLNTTWGQGCGYNSSCPLASDGHCGHALTGCVATAMAQILRYHAFPSSFNWSNMPNNLGSAETARLMYNIGASVGMNYGGVSSVVEWKEVGSRVVNSLRNTFEYSSSVKYIEYFGNSDLVKTEIRNCRPVFMRGGEKEYWMGIIPYYGGGHAWVCDGYSETEYVNWCTHLYLHMNWGWNGSANGWFGYASFNPTVNDNTYDFNYKSGCVIGIKP